jgi:hypothetical protein
LSRPSPVRPAYTVSVTFAFACSRTARMGLAELRGVLLREYAWRVQEGLVKAGGPTAQDLTAG